MVARLDRTRYERHGHSTLEGLENLPTLMANSTARTMGAVFKEFFTASNVEKAGLTWEQASSLYGALDAKFWEAMIPNMGYMALLRNLRNFDEAKISDEASQAVITKLTDPDEVAGSRQLPLRFYAAYDATVSAGSKVWEGALEKALDLTLANIPRLPGRTLVMVDSSGSMFSGFSGRGKVQRYQLAGLFGAALTLRNDADMYAYDTQAVKIAVKQGESVLRAVDAIRNAGLSGGTSTWACTAASFKGHDRIVIITDEQAHPHGTHESIPAEVPVYTFNVAGYAKGHAPSFNEAKRYTFGGLTDAGFAAIAALEEGPSAIFAATA